MPYPKARDQVLQKSDRAVDRTPSPPPVALADGLDRVLYRGKVLTTLGSPEGSQ